MTVKELRKQIALKQKKGLPFIMASVVIWSFIAIVSTLKIHIDLKNILVFSCSMPMLPIAWFIGKRLGVDIFAKDNELGDLGFLFTMNQLLYLLIVMWVFNAVPDKMIMVYAMVYGAHLLPYSWLYQSKAYKYFSIIIPILSLIVGNLSNGFILAIMMIFIEIVFVIMLWFEIKNLKSD